MNISIFPLLFHLSDQDKEKGNIHVLQKELILTLFLFKYEALGH